MKEERIEPIKITDKDTNETYELDFSRESVRFVEAQGFKIDETFDFPNTNIPKLFFYAFRKNHKKMAKNQTDALLDKMGGLTGKIAERLVLLYQQATTSNNIIQDDEDLIANPHVTVEL